RFRAFLLTAFKNFLATEQERARTLKRGGGRTFLALDFDGGERRYHQEPSHQATPEWLYERSWALTLLDQGLTQLREELAGAGKERLFEYLKSTLTVEATPRPYAGLAAGLGM